jgi:BirA family transcriptional regulator, biotin operon repressor / biotin---[acetyl-CoA-carboxylase] ligase
MSENRILHFGSVDSTNDQAARLAAEGELAEGTVVNARKQTHGRGQDTNTWESEPAMNLTCSMVLYPRFLPAAAQFALSKVVALGVWKTVADILPKEQVTIKWPNDVYIGDRKVAGILIQNSIMGPVLDCSIAGIGLNVNQTAFSGRAPNPVSLAMITGEEYSLAQVLGDLIKNIETYYAMLKSRHYTDIAGLYFEKLYRRGVMSRFRRDGVVIEAKIIGINEYGHLLLEQADGTRFEADVKEIGFII